MESDDEAALKQLLGCRCRGGSRLTARDAAGAEEGNEEEEEESDGVTGRSRYERMGRGNERELRGCFRKLFKD